MKQERESGKEGEEAKEEMLSEESESLPNKCLQRLDATCQIGIWHYENVLAMYKK